MPDQTPSDADIAAEVAKFDAHLSGADPDVCISWLGLLRAWAGYGIFSGEDGELARRLLVRRIVVAMASKVMASGYVRD